VALNKGKIEEVQFRPLKQCFVGTNLVDCTVYPKPLKAPTLTLLGVYVPTQAAVSLRLLSCALALHLSRAARVVVSPSALLSPLLSSYLPAAVILIHYQILI
jgi:hypothetical protein